MRFRPVRVLRSKFHQRFGELFCLMTRAKLTNFLQNDRPTSMSRIHLTGAVAMDGDLLHISRVSQRRMGKMGRPRKHSCLHCSKEIVVSGEIGRDESR